MIYTKQSKLKVVKLIELNNKYKSAASCKDIVHCSIRRNSTDRYAYENTLRDYDVIFRQLNWRLRSSDRVRTHDERIRRCVDLQRSLQSCHE